eukprot:347697_1
MNGNILGTDTYGSGATSSSDALKINKNKNMNGNICGASTSPSHAPKINKDRNIGDASSSPSHSMILNGIKMELLMSESTQPIRVKLNDSIDEMSCASFHCGFISF